MITQIRHKNDTSDDLGTFMGKVKNVDLSSRLTDYNMEDRKKLE